MLGQVLASEISSDPGIAGVKPYRLDALQRTGPDVHGGEPDEIALIEEQGSPLALPNALDQTLS